MGYVLSYIELNDQLVPRRRIFYWQHVTDEAVPVCSQIWRVPNPPGDWDV
jgi:hypothetical protein